MSLRGLPKQSRLERQNEIARRLSSQKVVRLRSLAMTGLFVFVLIFWIPAGVYPDQSVGAGMTTTTAYAALPAPEEPVNQDSESMIEKQIDSLQEEPLNIPDQPSKAKVLKILEEGEEIIEGGYREKFQNVSLKILNGKEKGQTLEIRHSAVLTLDQWKPVQQGQTVVLVKTESSFRGVEYFITDTYRVPALAWVLMIFFALAVFFGRWKGLSSILGLAVSILILAKFIVPQILNGANPLAVTLIGSVAILCVSLFLAHGFNKRTALSLGSTLITLGLASLLSLLFVTLAKLTGLGTEEAVFLQTENLPLLNLQGLLLGGIIIGTLGVLDDITTAQTAVVDELKKANPSLSRFELYKRGISVGREHIASLVNTLVLAYAGASLPLFLLFSLNNNNPLWLTLNSEFISEEIIRTLVGSSALILAVPITTALAAFVFSKKHSK